MIILCFDNSLSCIVYLFLHIMHCITYSASDSFFTICSISILVNNSNSILVFFKYACHTNPGTDKYWARSSSYVSMYFFLQKFSDIFVSNNASLWTCKSWWSPRSFSSKSFQTFHVFVINICNVFDVYICNVFDISSYCKILFYLQILFHWIFVGYPSACLDKFLFLALSKTY